MKDLGSATCAEFSPHFNNLLPDLTAALEGALLHILFVATNSNDEGPAKTALVRKPSNEF